MARKAGNFATETALSCHSRAIFPSCGHNLHSHMRAIILALNGWTVGSVCQARFPRERDMAVQTLIGLRTATRAAVAMLLLSAATAFAEDAAPAPAPIARPSVEEL